MAISAPRVLLTSNHILGLSRFLPTTFIALLQSVLARVQVPFFTFRAIVSYFAESSCIGLALCISTIGIDRPRYYQAFSH